MGEHQISVFEACNHMNKLASIFLETLRRHKPAESHMNHLGVCVYVCAGAQTYTSQLTSNGGRLTILLEIEK